MLVPALLPTILIFMFLFSFTFICIYAIKGNNAPPTAKGRTKHRKKGIQQHIVAKSLKERLIYLFVYRPRLNKTFLYFVQFLICFNCEGFALAYCRCGKNKIAVLLAVLNDTSRNTAFDNAFIVLDYRTVDFHLSRDFVKFVIASVKYNRFSYMIITTDLEIEQLFFQEKSFPATEPPKTPRAIRPGRFRRLRLPFRLGVLRHP